MKNEWVALITDQHFGVRNNSQVFLDYYFKFYEETFFPTLKEYGIENKGLELSLLRRMN